MSRFTRTGLGLLVAATLSGGCVTSMTTQAQIDGIADIRTLLPSQERRLEIEREVERDIYDGALAYLSLVAQAERAERLISDFNLHEAPYVRESTDIVWAILAAEDKYFREFYTTVGDVTFVETQNIERIVSRKLIEERVTQRTLAHYQTQLSQAETTHEAALSYADAMQEHILVAIAESARIPQTRVLYRTFE